MKTRKYISLNYLVVFACLSCYFADVCYARSVYTITKCAGGQLTAYDIRGDQIVYQINTQIDTWAIGLALDPESEILFVTYDGSDKLVLVDAKTMTQIKSIPTTDELCGIAFDQSRQKLYATSRDDKKLYIYMWNSLSQTLTLDKILALSEIYQKTYGIAMDDATDVLYIADETNVVKMYDANDPNFGYLGSIEITVSGTDREAVSIDFYRDSQGNKYLYTGSWMHSTQHEYLVRTDINDVNNPFSVQHDVGAGVISVAADQTTGYVYVTTSNNHIEVYNNATFPSDPCDIETSDISGPADIIVRADVSYKPPVFDLVKDDNDVDCVSPLISEAEHELLEIPYNWLYYNIEYDANGFADTNVIITDYLPLEVDYFSSDPCGLYDSNTHTVTWDINDMSASDSNSFRIQVGVNYYAKPGYTITNYCEIEGDQYRTFTSWPTDICCYGGDIIYVNKVAVGFNNGTSWLDAYTDLQEALHTARKCGCEQIWVAEGTYKPTNKSDTGARLISFELLDGITIYGGFPPGGGTLFDRDPNAYETILSGDIGTPIDQNDNSYHVLKCDDVNNAILDGFTITAGNADAYSPYDFEPNQWGGGIYCEDSNDLMVTNCAFSGNLAIIGGGMYNEQSSPTLINCTFSGNSVTTTDGNTYGGAIFNWYYSNPNITNCTFSGNSATTTGQYSSYGGAICNWDYSNPNITNCIFNGNTSNATASNSTGGGVCNVRSSPTITNCVFSGNTANATSPSYYSWGGGIQDINSFSTVTNCIFSGNWADYGGGMESWDSSPIVTNCTFSGNSADYGGGMHNDNNSDPNVTNCTFSNNSAREGGAVHNYDHSDPNISNCVFNGNTADFYGGGMVNSNESSPKIINCTFSGNSTTVTGDYSHGGAMCNWIDSDANITNCTFSNNSAREGGAVYNYYSDPNIINCIFSGNTADVNGGGIYNYNSSSSMIRNSTFSNNSAYVGGAVCNYYSDPNISNCIFSGNTSDFFGGGMGNFYDSSPKITNCIFSGNSAGGYGGGGIGNAFQSPATITNCTFSGNYAYGGSYGGGGMCNWESSPMVTNCILWDNEAVTVYDEIYNYDANSDPNISYCDIEDSNGSGAKWGRKLGEDHGGNIDEDPCFFDVEQTTYSWTENASYDNSTFQSTLTDSGADWSVNQLAGKFVSPNTPQLLQFFIVSNDVNTIKVWSDVESIATSGDPYQIYDYHLKVESPCIDAGDPNGDYTGWKDIDGEPRVFDGDANETEIVDMGADEYYWSPADFDSDGLVNFFDYALLAGVWLINPTDQYTDVYDLIDNNRIDSNDLARFCEDWLWQTAWAKTFPFAYETMGRGMGKSMGEGLDFTQDLFPSVSAKQDQPELTAADIEEIIKWLQELWLTDDEVRKVINEDEWLEFIESVMQVLKQLIYN